MQILQIFIRKSKTMNNSNYFDKTFFFLIFFVWKLKTKKTNNFLLTIIISAQFIHSCNKKHNFDVHILVSRLFKRTGLDHISDIDVLGICMYVHKRHYGRPGPLRPGIFHRRRRNGSHSCKNRRAKLIYIGSLDTRAW